jgi:hypothetical protein
VEDENPNVVAGLLERLGRDDLKVPTARELGVVLRAILASKLLPGQSIETLEDAASRYKDESTASIGMYRRNCQLRDMEFRRLRDLLSAMAEKYGFKVVTNLERRSLGLDSVVKPEEDSESTPHGRFETRNLTCSTLDGDCLHLRFDGVPQFRRPWPDVTGLLSKGLLSVVFQGAPSAILLRPLELWFSGMDTILGSREPDRFAYLEAGDFEHALRVLSGDIYPGVPEPVVVPRKHSSSDASKLSAQYRALQKHEIPFAKPGRGKADKGMPHRH